MPSYAALWIPTIVVAHLIGLALILYALEELNGAVSGLIRLAKWYCGCYKGTDLQKHDSTGSTIAKDELPELSPAAEEERKKRHKRGRRKRKENNVSVLTYRVFGWNFVPSGPVAAVETVASMSAR